MWIGYDCIVLAGTKIGKGSVIGARSVVTGIISPYSVYVGNKVLKKRFGEDIIKEIETIDYSNLRHSVADDCEKYCTEEVNLENLNKIKEAFENKLLRDA